jgi:hypothetical protein
MPTEVIPFDSTDGDFKFYKLRNKVVYNIGVYVRAEFMGYIFNNFPEELWPQSKHALVIGNDGDHK